MGMKNKIDTINDLQSVIEKIDNLKFCYGSQISEDIDSVVETSIAFKDKDEFTRHKNCTLLLSPNDQEKSCKFCKGLKKTLDQKIRRMEKKKNNSGFHVPNLSFCQRKYIKIIKENLKNSKRKNRRIFLRLKFLKNCLERNRRELKEISEKSLLEMDQRNVS